MSGPTFEGRLVVRDGLLPERWPVRPTPALVVPLLAGESRHVVHALTQVAPDADEDLARLVAEGATDREIARQLRMRMRGVERRIAMAATTLRPRPQAGGSRLEPVRSSVNPPIPPSTDGGRDAQHDESL